ncbi:hypothetical protein [Neobacillus vireti]|uniref:hypothetical protein n=1 Tax=Neobacillus vireti TaxID=220686 RepID=UPI002FFEA146
MLGILEGFLEKVVKLKDVKEEACRNGLLIILAQEITHHYRFLIPNERNKLEATSFQQWLESAPVINEAREFNDEFDLYFVLKGELDKANPSSERILEYLIANSIILKEGEEVRNFCTYYKPFTKSGSCFARNHRIFKRTELAEPYRVAFNNYLTSLMLRENIEFNRISYDYNFIMNFNLLYPIVGYQERIQLAIKSPSDARMLLSTINNWIKKDLEGLYFNDLFKNSTKVKICIPFNKLRDYGFSDLEQFEEYYGENRKVYPERNPSGYKYDISKNLSLIVTKNTADQNIIFCCVTLALGRKDLFNRLYKKEVQCSIQ